MPSRKKMEWSREALREITDYNMSVRKAAELFNIPTSTLDDRKSGRIEVNATDGKKPKFSKEDEEKLIDYAAKQASLGIGFGIFFYLRYAGILAQKRGISFKHKSPTEKWYRLHKKRFGNTLSIIKPEPTAAIRHKQMATARVLSFFTALKTCMMENNILDNPDKISATIQ